MRRPLPIPLLLLAIAGGAVAQTTHAVAAGIVVQAGTAAPVQVLSGTNVDPGVFRAVANTTGGASFGAVHATTTAAVELRWDLAVAAQHAGAVGAQGAIRYELSAPETVAGELVVEWTAASSGTGAASFAFDLFDDQIDVVTAPASYALQLGRAPLPFRAWAAATASAGTVSGPWGTQWSYRGTAAGTLVIRFVPRHCTVVVVAPGCASPQFDAVPNLLGGADLRGRCGQAGDLAVFVLGFDQQPMVLPLAPGCALATTPVATIWSVPDARGEASWSLAIPAAARPVACTAQLVGIDLLAALATTSRALRLSCR
ncbi:MAG: hypothetical protein FJ265_12790 [Planctomycetes bacterium]|nr:hypothetical protein [Planctomycetota bacterium]